MIATNLATGLEIEGEDNLRPVTWKDWSTLLRLVLLARIQSNNDGGSSTKRLADST
jgi:hypothetical protein